MRRVWLLVLVAACGGGGGGGDDDDGPTDGPRTEAHAACIDETNRLRQAEGRPPVEWWADLEAYADDGAEYDHHNSPHDHFGMEPAGERIAFAENECPRWGLEFGGGDMVDLMLACIEAFYSEGPGGGHYENMMGDYGTLGCGIYEEDGLVTIVQDFGF